MENQSFDWDDDKAEYNERTHRVSFEESTSVFADFHSITIYDSDHSDDEDRYIDIGYASSGRLLIVVYTERDDLIRIISSRLADKNERRHYEYNRI